ncbi:hypothetical protein [Candidatus Methylacidiphilum infernorum]|uniref:Uncharacterized protein n=1 Tax=Methylacidiphilum infernorum (isolate V4) TaxID=481448 RepID=B3E0V7_METI4|nr:hypothetical protein [Candidatus Methylacidiphilum infernorum]ACD84434.1 Hypothetical protein Minf_2380 [Methylacidiphilum infernorum V4]
MADHFKAIDEDQWYKEINLPKELQPEVDRYLERMKNHPLGKERKDLRDQFKSYLMEYFEKENKELFEKGKKKISQKLEQFLDFFDHVPPPDMDRHIPGKNTPLQEVEIHHPIGIHCINYRSFKDWDNMDLEFFGDFEDIHTPSFISQRDKVMGWNLYTIAKNNPRSLTLSYNGALHFSKNIGGLPRETTLAEELDGYGIKFKLAGRSPQEYRVIWNGKTYEEKAKEIREQASLLEEGLEAKNKESYLNLNLYQDKQRYLSLDLDRYRQRDRGGYGR